MFQWILKKIRSNEEGFTLVELVVVIAILGILAGIAVPKLSESRKTAAIAAHNANVRTLESAATLAVSEGSGEITWGPGEEGKTDDEDGKGWENYLQSWPDMPKGIQDLVEVEDGVEDGNEITEKEYKVDIDGDGGITVTPGKIATD